MVTASREVLSQIVIICSFLLIILAGIIIRYIFLYQKKLYSHQQELRELRETFNHTLLTSKLEIQEQTLDHISKELHANFSHLVSLININLSELLIKGPVEIKESILETKSLARQLMSDLKVLSASLNTDHILHIGFLEAFKNELKRLEKYYKITLTVTGEQCRLMPEHEIILFRLCQEILNNIIQYSKAKYITASLKYSSEVFELTIRDDGIGFDFQKEINEISPKVSTGILNMRKRATLINADIKFNSELNKGTEVCVIIPISNS
jgi:signal transduction histidine kinase